jgi:hypothetical protein
MGCNCGGGSGLANYVVKKKDGTEKKFTAVRKTEVDAFAAKNPGSMVTKTS